MLNDRLVSAPALVGDKPCTWLGRASMVPRPSGDLKGRPLTSDGVGGIYYKKIFRKSEKRYEVVVEVT